MALHRCKLHPAITNTNKGSLIHVNLYFPAMCDWVREGLCHRPTFSLRINTVKRYFDTDQSSLILTLIICFLSQCGS